MFSHPINDVPCIYHPPAIVCWLPVPIMYFPQMLRTRICPTTIFKVQTVSVFLSLCFSSSGEGLPRAIHDQCRSSYPARLPNSGCFYSELLVFAISRLRGFLRQQSYNTFSWGIFVSDRTPSQSARALAKEYPRWRRSVTKKFALYSIGEIRPVRGLTHFFRSLLVSFPDTS